MRHEPVRRGDPERQGRRLDLAARAAWLYYIGGDTQDEIAAKLNVSRQAAQRLVALAVDEHLIKFRVDHPIAACMELAEALRARFAGLDFCQVTPGGGADGGAVAAVAVAAAEQLEAYLAPKAPTVLAFGTGRTLRAAVDQVAAMDRPQHQVVSLVGTMTRDGRASPYDIVRRLADRVGAQCFPLPTPVLADTAEECRLLQCQRPYRVVRELAAAARVAFVGVGGIHRDAPLHRDGFVGDAELAELIDRGAVGEIAGWAYDPEGRLVGGSLRERLTAVPLDAPPRRLTVAVAGGRDKAPAILAALRGRLVSGLITDEDAARVILAAA